MEPELKPCPFCGGADIRVRANCCACEKCDASGPEHDFGCYSGEAGEKHRADAITTWNTRTDGPRGDDELAGMAAAWSASSDSWSMLAAELSHKLKQRDELLQKVLTERDALKARLNAIQAVVNEQAEDGGLWFMAQTAAEAYLQSELRKLHAAIEGDQ